MHRSGVKIIYLALTLLGCREIGIGLLQLFGLKASLHADQAYTGTFYNSGPYACYLAVLWPIIIYAIRHINNNGIIPYLYRGIAKLLAFACVILIPGTLSRTAIIGVGVGTICAFVNPIIELFRQRKKLLIIVATIMSVFFVLGISSIKKSSSSGRIFIWKIALETVHNIPWSGVGWDNVAGRYGEVQEYYFNTDQRTYNQVMVADAPEYVFNEYLQVAIAFGPFVATAMVLLIIGAFIVSYKSKNYGIAGSIAVISIVMFASYPLQFPIFAITITIILMLAWLSSPSLPIRTVGVLATILAYVLFLCFNDKTDVRSAFAEGHSFQIRGNSRKSNAILIPLMSKSSDPMILNIIGKNYQALGMPDSAEYYFRKSTFRCPNRMYPHYLLMNFYADSLASDKTKCLNEANTILTMPVKIPSPAVDEMQRDAGLMIKKLAE